MERFFFFFFKNHENIQIFYFFVLLQILFCMHSVCVCGFKYNQRDTRKLKLQRPWQFQYIANMFLQIQIEMEINGKTVKVQD